MFSLAFSLPVAPAHLRVAQFQRFPETGRGQTGRGVLHAWKSMLLLQATALNASPVAPTLPLIPWECWLKPHYAKGLPLAQPCRCEGISPNGQHLSPLLDLTQKLQSIMWWDHTLRPPEAPPLWSVSPKLSKNTSLLPGAESMGILVLLRFGIKSQV